MDSLAKLAEAIIKALPRIAGATFILCGVILILPFQVLKFVSLQTYREQIVLALLASGAILATYAIHVTWNLSARKVRQWSSQRHAKKRLQNLTYEERKSSRPTS